MLDCTDVIIPKLTTVSKYLRVRAYDLRHTGVQFFHQYCKTRGVLDVDVIVPHRTASLRSSRGLLVVLSLAIGSSFHQVLAKTSSFAYCSIAKFAVSGNELLFLHSS